MDDSSNAAYGHLLSMFVEIGAVVAAIPALIFLFAVRWRIWVKVVIVLLAYPIAALVLAMTIAVVFFGLAPAFHK